MAKNPKPPREGRTKLPPRTPQDVANLKEDQRRAATRYFYTGPTSAAAPVPPSPPPPPPIPALVSEIMAIPFTNRNFWCQNGSGSGAAAGSSQIAWANDSTNGKGTYRSRHYMAADACDIRAVLINTSQDPGAAAVFGAESFTGNWANADLGQTIVTGCALEWLVAGVTKVIPFTFQGKQQPSIDEGGVAVSDPLNIHLLRSIQPFVYARCYVQAAVGTYWPGLKECFGGDSEGYVTNSNLTGVGSGGGFASSAMNMYSPLLLLGTTNPKAQVVLGGWGDSILAGAKNRTKDGALQGVAVTTNDFSFLDYANGISTPTYPLVKWCRASLLAQTDAEAITGAGGTYHSVRQGMMRYCSHIMILIGANDLNNGRTAAQLQGDVTTICNFAKLNGSKTILCTLPPRTTSSDNWATAGNQAVLSSEPQRVLFNTWVRFTAPAQTSTYGNLPLVDYVFDTCATCEVNAANVPTSNGGIWKATGVAQHFTPDGIHFAFDGNQNLVNLDPALISLLSSLKL